MFALTTCGCGVGAGPNRSLRQLELVAPSAAMASVDERVALRSRDQLARANAGLVHRRHVLVQTFVDDLVQHGLDDYLRNPCSDSFRRIAAGLYALGQARAAHTADGVQAGAEADDDDTDLDPVAYDPQVPQDFPAQVERYTRTLYPFRPGTVGGLSKQRGDYDFLMKEMVSLLYVFRDRPDLLSDDAAFNIVDRALAGLAGRRVDGRLSFRVSVPLLGELLEYPETENHVLMTLSSMYLTNQWITDNPRHDPRLRQGRYRHLGHFDNRGSALMDTLLQAMGRVLHNGFFEVNGRPYQAMTAHALMNLSTFAKDSRVRVAAHNALDLLATKFAFQSLEMKRIGPYRRSAHNVRTPGIYGNDGVIFMFGALAGGYRWPDAFFHDGNAAGHALWATLLGYRVPVAVHDFMLDKHQGYWARMQARFGAADYAHGRPAHYFRQDGKVYVRGRPEFLQELYFATPRFLNAGGGRYNRYPIWGDGLTSNDGVHDLDFLARPLTLIPRGHLSQWSSLSEMADEVLLMQGEKRFWRSDNSGTYKSFSYGYHHNGDRDRHLDLPIRIPRKLQPYLYREGSRERFANDDESRARFSFLDLSKLPGFGYYVVLATVSKSENDPGYRNYARGFWEIVPAERFESVRTLKSYVLRHNPSSAFTDATEGPRRYYHYAMTTGETLELDDLLGAHGSKCENPIRKVWPPGANPGRDAPLWLSEVLFDRCDPNAVARMPLLDVREIDRDYQLTGTRLAYAAGDGKLWVQNPYLRASLLLDSSDYRHPKRIERAY